MPMLRPALFAIALLAFAGGAPLAAQTLPPVDPAIASMSIDQKVELRQKLMKEDGMLLRQARSATGDTAVQAATTVLQNFVNFPALFADHANNTISEADSRIWDDFDAFADIFRQGQLDAANMLAAARSGDQAAYQAAYKSLGQKCFECHQSYRID